MLRLGRIVTPRYRNIAWGFVDQGFSSATNFGLSLLAGRLLGPSGLGRVFLAFSIYLVVLTLQRSAVTEVLVAITSALDPERRARTAALALTVSLAGSFAATIVVLLLGLLIPGTGGTALLLVAPWLMASLTQDYWRSLLFRERRASAAAGNDAAWFLAMAVTLPLAWALKTEWAVMAVWGLGACAGALLGFRQTRLAPASLRDAWRWWREDAWPFGRWNTAAAMVLNVGWYNAAAFVLAAIIGARALGGFRAVESIFAPLSLIAPAIALPGLPAVARAYAVDVRQAKGLVIRLSSLAVAISLVFFAVLFLGGWQVLPLLFGPRFRRYQELVPALATSQIFAAAGIGFPLLIKVQQRGRFLFVARLAVTAAGLGIIVATALRYGLMGAAWGTATVALLSSVTFGLGALLSPAPPPALDPAPYPDPRL
jgi:O-antigen/teichoic acid export membrane protein